VAEDPHRSFEVDPRALFAALRAERAGGAKLIGHYHSHPNGLATPSARDAAAAEPGWLWMIVGGGEAGLWIAEEGAAFRPVRLTVA
jgi:proteasome lid subunit RPN8/RPN11